MLTGIRKDRYGYRAYVRVGKIQREKRFKRNTPVKKMRAWRDETRLALGKIPQDRPAAAGSL